MDNEKPVTLKLTGSIAYETKITDTLAVHIMALCVSGAAVPSSSGVTSPRDETFIKESVAEYLTRVGAKRNPDKILAFAAYLAEQQQKKSVSPAELKLLFREAGESLPANFNRDFNDTTASGWLAQEPQKKGYYYVTRTGMDVVDKGFEKTPVKRLYKTPAAKKPTQSEGE